MVKSACTKVAASSHWAARSRLARKPRITRAPSPINSEATAEPRPPEPPANTTSRPFRDSCNRRDLFVDCLVKCQISAGHHHEKHRQYFAVAQVVLEDSTDHRAQHHR